MRIAIVTGATSGLGRAFLDEWQRRGVKLDEVWLVARHAEDLARTAADLPWQTRCFAIDLADKAARAELFAALEKACPRVRYVVNSAGYGKLGDVADIDADAQLGMVELNCEALVDISQRVLPYMSRGSVMFEIASVAAFAPQPGFAVYAATKGFVQYFARALNVELKDRGIEVISVCPNPMDTGFFKRAGGTPSGLKQYFFESTEGVVRAAMDAVGTRRDVVTNCAVAGALRVALKIVPHRFVFGIERTLLK
ncbi:MAG: SDR family NAD(P)-dependent oxidoreductase [Peptococcaceae bacterium]|nr:SDR family NAD(P)-dependent oxidoreductase [Peptococcaceae bacterium]